MVCILLSATAAVWIAKHQERTEEYCAKDQAGKEDCATYDVMVIPLLKTAAFFSVYSAAIQAFSGLAVALFTTVLAWFTVRLSKSTARLVQGGEETARRQLRAYLNVEHIRRETVDGKWLIFVRIQNYGLTPAYNVAPILRVGSKPCPFNPDDCVRIEETDRPESKYPIAPGGFIDVRPGKMNCIPRSPQNDGLADGCAVWVVGKIIYDDTLGVAHTTYLRYSAMGDDWKGGNFVAAHVGNDCD